MCAGSTEGGCGGCGQVAGLLGEAVANALFPKGTLAVQTVLIPAGLDGVEVDWHVPFAAVAVNVVGTSGITINAGTKNTSAVTSGAGVAVLPANKGGVFNLRGHSLTVWGGTAGDAVTLQAFTHPQPPSWG